MGRDSDRSGHYLSSYYLNLYSWKNLAYQVQPIIGDEMEAFIEENNRYIIRSYNKDFTVAGDEYLFYIRLQLWQNNNEKEESWVKVDYLALSRSLRKRGKGKKVVELLKKWIEDQGVFDYICLYARDRVVPFWSSCGFIKDEERMLYELGN